MYQPKNGEQLLGHADAGRNRMHLLLGLHRRGALAEFCCSHHEMPEGRALYCGALLPGRFRFQLCLESHPG